jgi:hypothetical protein
MEERQKHQGAGADQERRDASAHRLDEVGDVAHVGHDRLEVARGDLVDGVEGVGVEQPLREEYGESGTEGGDRRRHRETPTITASSTNPILSESG